MTLAMTLTRETFLNLLAKDALTRGVPEAAFLNFVNAKVQFAKRTNDSWDVFFKVIQDLKQEAIHMRNVACEEGDDFYVMMADSNIKVLNAIV